MPTLRISGTGSSTYCYIKIGSSSTKRYSDGYSTTVSTGTTITAYLKEPSSVEGNGWLQLPIIGEINPDWQEALFAGESKTVTFEMPKTDVYVEMMHWDDDNSYELIISPDEYDSFRRQTKILINGTIKSLDHFYSLVNSAKREYQTGKCCINGTNYLVTTGVAVAKWLKKTSKSATTGEYVYEKRYYLPAYGEYDSYWYELQPMI